MENLSFFTQTSCEVPQTHLLAEKTKTGILVSMSACTEGHFWMGHEKDANAPLHLVEVHSPFEISTHLVTQGLWTSIFDDNPSNWLGSDLPVERVSWIEAVIFCNKLSMMADLEPCYRLSDAKIAFDGSKKGYRLPFEIEWEYAAKADDGNKIETLKDFAGSSVYSEVANEPQKNKSRHTHTVGLKSPNTWGLYDMTGNLNEWCNDLFDQEKHLRKFKNRYTAYHFDVSEEAFEIDLQKMHDFSKLNCVVRGGSWFNSPEYSKVHTRIPQNILYPSSMVGIRLARTV